MAAVEQLKPAPAGGIWREGNRLVVHKKAALPEICVRTNEKATSSVQRKFYWHHPAVFVAILVNLLVYVILAIVLRKKHVLVIPISESVKKSRFNKLLIAWMAALFFLATFIGSIVLMVNSESGGSPGPHLILFFGLLLSPLFGIIAGAIAARIANVLQPKKMTDEYTWFSGANADYLNRFPEI